ncbi:MAG: fatty-acid synthase [bacterium]|nr:fatty-acid synthase [bacterium]
MSRLDIYHDSVRRALERDDWNITHDPFTLKFGRKTLYADLGAERLIAADKGMTKIVVEVRSFLGPSDIHDLQGAFGQYMMYEDILQEQGSGRVLYLAVSETTFNGIFSTDIGQLLMSRHPLRLIVFDEESEVIRQWIPS